MSIAAEVIRGGSWLALYKIVSQGISWIITILIARILIPDDYGLLAMATIITGYAEMFSSLGLGAAIIQKSRMRKEDLSSIFWFSLVISCLFGASCFPISYLTAAIFDNLRIVPYTQAVSVIFVLSGLQVVPLALLRKELSFKKLGLMETISTVVSSLSILLLAHMGAGVWSLLIGRIMRTFCMLVLIVLGTKWCPQAHFNVREARPYIKFGIMVAVGASFYYISEASDKFFAGRAWSAMLLGYYTFALQLAQIPTEKIVVLINQVSFPAFSKLQDDDRQFNRLYLDIVKITGVIVFPLFVGGFIVGEELIKVVLDEKWYPVCLLFRYLCLTQIIVALNVFNNFVQDAKGRPHWSLGFNLASAIVMPVSFWVAAKHGFETILIPWFTSYFAMCLVWIFITLRSIGIGYSAYARELVTPAVCTLLMAAGLVILRQLGTETFAVVDRYSFSYLGSAVLVGGGIYLGCLWVFDRSLICGVQRLRKG